MPTKTTLPQMPVSSLAPLRPADDFGLLDTSLAPALPDSWGQSEARLARERSATRGDYLGSMWRQDGIVDGATAWLASRTIEADPAYNALTDTSLTELERGIRPDLVPELYQASSKSHAYFIRDRLLQKQEDQQRLEDMGALGQAGRFAFGVVMPENLLAGAATGGATYAAGAYRAGRAVKLAKDASTLARMEAAAGLAASNASRSAGVQGVVTAVGIGAAENAGIEKLRQGLNYEHDTSGVLMAGLMGAGLTLPFAVRGARAGSRAADVAFREVEAIRALRKLEEGGAPSAAEVQSLRQVHEATRIVHELETGRLAPEDAEKALDGLHGPQEPDELWLTRFSERMREDSSSWISENAPNANGRATGRPAPSDAARARMDGAVDLETKLHFPGSAAEANSKNPAIEGPGVGAFRRLLEDRVKARKAADLAGLDATTAAAHKVERDAHWAAADADHAEARRLSEEHAYNQRELLAAQDNPLHVAPAPVAPSAPVEAPVAHPHEKWVGKGVSWQGREGETLEGTVAGFNRDIGKLLVDTPEGRKAVLPETLDQYAGPAPEGFTREAPTGGQSVGAAQVAGSTIDRAETGFRKLRFDYAALFNGSPLRTVRTLAGKLVKDGVGNGYEAQAMSASEWKDHTRRVIAGAFHVDRQAAFNAAVKDLKVSLWERHAFEQEFHQWVTKATHDPNFLSSLPAEAQAHVQKASGAMQTFYRRMLKAAQDAGVKGAEHVKADDLYTNRIWHQGQIRDLARLHGDESLYSLIASGIKDKQGVIERMRKRPGMEGKTDAELLHAKGKGFLQAVKALEFSPAIRDAALGGRDMGTLRTELHAMGVQDNHIDDLVDLLFEVKPQDADAGRMANLKFRFQLDPAAEVKTPQGIIRMSDLWENDARVLVDHYAQGMAGRVGLAKHGITSDADWARQLQAVAEEGKLNLGSDAGRISADVQRLQDVYNHIVGRPMSDQAFSFANRSAGVLRAYTRSVMLPQLGIAAFFEMNKAVAMFGFKNMMTQLPSLRGFLQALRQGYLPDAGLARQVRLMSGFGSELAGHYARGQEISDGFFGQAMSRTEYTANRLSHITDRLSGNASLTSLSKQWSALGAIQELSGLSRGRKLGAKQERRWLSQGVEDPHELMAAFKEHSEVDAKGTVTGIDYERWQQSDPRTYETFQTFLSRQAREAIQDHDIGEAAPFMHGPIGKIFGELKTFFLVGHAKNTLKNLFYNDQTMWQVFTIGFLAEALAYSVQSAINFPGELDARLQPDKVAGAAFFRMASMGSLSMLIESSYNVVTGGDSLVSPGTTANDSGRSFLNTPSMIVYKRTSNAFTTLAGMAFGTDMTTRKEAQDLVGAIPVFGRMYGVNSLLQAWAAGHPKSDPTKTWAGH